MAQKQPQKIRKPVGMAVFQENFYQMEAAGCICPKGAKFADPCPRESEAWGSNLTCPREDTQLTI